MALPITGPTTSNQSVSGHGPGTFTRNRVLYRQAKPYDRPLAYTSLEKKVLYTNYASTAPDNGGANNANLAAGGVVYPTWTYGDFPYLYQRAFGKFREELSASAQWLVNFIERKQAMEMVVYAAEVLVAAARAARRGDPRGLARALKVNPVLKPAKKSGELWLQYHFGWEPMIGDIATGIEILQSPIRTKTVKGSARTSPKGRLTTNPGNYYTVANFNWRNVARVSADIEVTNPMLYKANQLGFINPASVAWEVVPFSFVVDWFVPVGAFLDSFTWDVGLKVTHPQRTLWAKVVNDYQLIPYVSGIPYGHSVVVGYTTRRTLDLPLPRPAFKPFRGMSPTRGATAIALLLQNLRSIK